MAVAIDFVALQNLLKSLGFYDFVLPWLLAFSIVFGILDKAGIFGGQGKNKGVEAIISLVFAFYVTFFTPYPGFLSRFFSNLFGGSILVLSGVLVSLLFIGIFGLQPSTMVSGIGQKMLLILAIIVAAILFLNAAGWATGLGGFGGINATEWITLVIFLVLIALAIWSVVHENPSASPAPPTPPAT